MKLTQKISPEPLLQMIHLLPLLGIMLACFNIWRPYSYWLDELYSITTSSLGWSNMFRSMLTDVHPPLYQIFLWVWIRCLGDYEPITRGFSLICALGAFTCLYFLCKRIDKWSRFLALSFFTTSWLFIYYAQEARSYALLLFLSTLLVLLFVSNKNSFKHFINILIVTILLGSTHYFGLILGSSVLFWLFIQEVKNHKRMLSLLITAAILLTWPIIEFSYGTLGNKTGGHFWIQVNGPMDTLAIFFRAMINPTQWINPFTVFLVFLGWVFVLLLLIYRFLNNRRVARLSENCIIVKLLFCLIWVLCAVAIIDLHTPISTERNFIVLLPIISTLIGLSLGTLNQARYGVICILVISLMWTHLQFNYSYNLLTAKWAPLQNWKASAEYLVKHVENHDLYYLRLTDSEEIGRIFNYYVKQISKDTLKVDPIYASMLNKISSPSLVLIGGVAANTVAQIEAAEKVKAEDTFYPTQSWENSTGVLLF